MGAAHPIKQHTLPTRGSLAAAIPAPNGFKAIKDAARRDFFTIRADAVQDAVLSMVDSIAEYLVWDGMDRRLRAVASATHTEHPEAVVSVQQIANDIKVRVGHDLCERTIERALKKLCDVGLLSSAARFHQGRRQASSYMLLYAPSMALRLDKSRRAGVQKPPMMSAIPQAEATRPQEQDIRQYQRNAPMRIGDMIPEFSMSSGQIGTAITNRLAAFPENQQVHQDSALQSCQHPVDIVKSTRANTGAQHGDFSQPEDNGCISEDPKDTGTHIPSPLVFEGGRMDNHGSEIPDESEVCRSAHQTPASDVPGETQQMASHPTSVSPLFNKEKENKKVFKNVYSISDFSKKDCDPVPIQVHVENDHSGYYLDPVHHTGWVSSNKQALKEHVGDLSKFLFFKGCRTMESMTAWFQKQECDLQTGITSIADILALAGVEQVEKLPAKLAVRSYGA
jgi:hypothetical protein